MMKAKIECPLKIKELEEIHISIETKKKIGVGDGIFLFCAKEYKDEV